jgi:hypothetical protein
MQSDNAVPDANAPDFDFNCETKQLGPITRTMKKLMDHKNAAQLAISDLCNFTKEHCAMCK